MRAALWGEEPLGARRLFSLIWHISPESALVRELDPEGAGMGWNLDTHLLATIAEVSDQTNAILASVHAKRGAPRWRPLDIWRPGKPRPRGTTMNQLRQMITEMRTNK